MRLEVYLGGDCVGWLGHDGESNRFSFDYAPSWLAHEASFPLSPALPFRQPLGTSADTHSAATRQFFENLLPEGRALDEAAAAYRVSKANLVGLLAVLGNETAGALSLRVAGSAAATAARSDRRYLSREELSARIRDRAQLPFSVWDGKVRLSIAGYQDKVAVFEDAADWYLVEGGSLASTHILKPEPTNPRLAGLTSNEFFCMRLAQAVKLPVADVQLHHVPEPVLVVTRFDRVVKNDLVHRLAAIDGCQALGLSAGFKYERPYGDSPDVRDIRDGASLPRFFSLIDTLARPAAERRALLRWVIFQVLIGNTDAHAKNLTFMAGPGGLTLAKTYDLVCGWAFDAERFESTYAMAIGDAFAPEDISALEWATLCLAAKLPPAMVRKELQRLASDTLTKLDEVADAVAREGANSAVVAKITGLVEAECRRQLEIAAHIPAIARYERAANVVAAKISENE